MSLVNNRVYGSDIPSRVKKILEARQLAAERKVNPESVIWQNVETEYWKEFLKNMNT